jgi:DNA-binding HxlR family transcriptional regulator
MNCSLARTLDIIGEWWTLLILREAMWGTSRFDDFHMRLGIARNVLTARLETLVTAKLIERRPTTRSARIFDYVLTEKGWGLFPAVVALMQWGDRWVHQKQGAPILFVERSTGAPIQTIAVRGNGGRVLEHSEIEILPGPGADGRTRRRAKKNREL